jgi:soluble lytic murein transglycosylase-like protein
MPYGKYSSGGLGFLRALCLLLAALLLWGNAVAAEPSSDLVWYRVKQGDTLSQLAYQTCESIESIATRNGIKNHNLIFVDQPLRLRSTSCNSPRQVASVTVSPGENVRQGRASREKQILTTPEKKLAPVFTPSRKESSEEELKDLPLSQARHDDIYRVVALRKLQTSGDISRAEAKELADLTDSLRRAVLERYPLRNAQCLYEKNAGRNWKEQTLFRVRCIRENYGTVIAAAAREYRLSESYLIAVIIIESGGRPDAISPTGCTGLKQFTLQSAKHYGLRDRFDPFESIRIGAKHLAQNLRYFGGNVDQATAAYNVGPLTVARSPGFDASRFSYTQSVRAVERLIDSV